MTQIVQTHYYDQGAKSVKDANKPVDTEWVKAGDVTVVQKPQERGAEFLNRSLLIIIIIIITQLSLLHITFTHFHPLIMSTLL